MNQYSDLDLECGKELKYCNYTILSKSFNLKCFTVNKQCHYVKNYKSKNRYKPYSSCHIQKSEPTQNKMTTAKNIARVNYNYY